jgi:hypothetical protein
MAGQSRHCFRVKVVSHGCVIFPIYSFCKTYSFPLFHHINLETWA